MNQTIAVPLALLCILVTWAYVWSHIAVRRTAKGEHTFFAHIFAGIYGIGAAFGTFLVTGATLMSRGDKLDAPMGIAGTVILLIYALVLIQPGKNKSAQPHQDAQNTAPPLLLPAPVHQPDTATSQGSSIQPSSCRALTVFSEADTAKQHTTAHEMGPSTPTSAPATVKQQSGESLAHVATHWQEGHQNRKTRSGERKTNRLTREQALGMPMSMFIAERYGSHMLFWAIMAVLTFDGYLLHQFNITQATDTTTPAIAITATVVITLVLLVVIVFSSSLMSILFFMLMPLAYLSTKVEAWLRIRLDMPYAPFHEADVDTTWRHTYSSHGDYTYTQDDDIEDIYPKRKRSRRQRKERYRSSSQSYNGNSDQDRSMDILIAFALGAWIGSAWGDDDGE